MTVIHRERQKVLEGTDNWNVGAISVPRTTSTSRVLLTASDVNGSIALEVYLPNSSTSLYSTTFAKTLEQEAGTPAIHAAQLDSHWGIDSIGHNFLHKPTIADMGFTPAGGRIYTFEYAIPTSADGTVYAIFEWEIDPRH